MTFPYPINVNIPNAPNDPADDQPEMKTNYANIAGFLQVDHVAAGVNPGAGFHKQVTYRFLNPPAAPTDPNSIGFTANSATLSNVTGSSGTVAQLFYRNQNGIFPCIPIKAFGTFTSLGAAVTGPIVSSNSINVTTVTQNAD